MFKLKNYSGFLILVCILMISGCSSGGGVLPGTDNDPPTWDYDTSIGVTSTMSLDGAIRVYWASATDADSSPVTYLIYIDTNNNPWDQAPIEIVGATSHTITDLINFTTYWIGVRCRDNASPTNIDDNVVVKSTQPGIPDIEPPIWDYTIGISDFEPADNEVTISWGKATDTQSSPVNYLIYLDTDDDPWDTEPIIQQNTIPYTFSGLDNQTDYWAGVRCRDSFDPPNVDDNDNVMWVPTAPADNTAPVWDSTVGITDLVVLDNTATVHFGTATEDKNAPVEYLLYIGFGDQLWLRPPVVLTTNDPYTFTDLDDSIEYWFGVRCRDSHVRPNVDGNENVGKCEIAFNGADPHTPFYLMSNASLTSADTMALQGNYAYIVDSVNGLTVMNISDPSNTFVVTTIDVDPAEESIGIAGNIAYVGGTQLNIIDISDPTNPVKVGHYDSPASHIAVQETLLFTEGEDAVMVIYDISDRLNPIDISERKVAGNRKASVPPSEPYSNLTACVPYGDLVVVGGLYFLYPTGTLSLDVYDITNPVYPEMMSNISHKTNCEIEPLVHNYYVYYNTYKDEPYRAIHNCDISDPENVVDGDYIQFSEGDEIQEFAIAGDYLYVVSDDLFSVIDISNPFNMYIYISIPNQAINYNCVEIKVQNNIAYVLSGNGQFETIQL